MQPGRTSSFGRSVARSAASRIVYGEARLSIGQSCLLFLIPDPSGVLQVMGMAQGHYPTGAG